MSSESTVEDLQRQLDAAYAAIQELDEDFAAGRISAADHATLKDRSERQAAALLQRLRQAEQRRAPAAPPAKSARAAKPAPRATLGGWLRGPIGLTVGGLLLVSGGVAMGVILGRSAETTAVAPGAPGTAGPAGAGDPQAGSRIAELNMLRKEVEPDDTPIRKLLAFAHLALDEGHTPSAIWAYRRVLAREPKNVEAITHMGIILYQGNHTDQALARIDEALAIDPKYAHALWDRAQILFHGKQDYAAAVRALEAFLVLVPTGEDAERARAMLTEARTRGAAGGRRG